MNKLLSIFLLISVAFVQAQGQAPQQGILVIDKLLGLNTKSGVFSLKPNDLTVAHNIDYTQIGAYQRRKGYDSVSAFTGMDSIVHNGIFPAFYGDGTQQLVAVTDSTGVGYGGVYLSPLGSADLSSATRIWDYWSVQTRPFFEQYRDNVYISNGSHRPIVYDKNSGLTRQVPPRAPGEPFLLPLNTNGSLNGEYRYDVRVVLIADAQVDDYIIMTNADGVISSLVKVSNGQMLLRSFSRPIELSVQNDTFAIVSPWEVRYVVDIDSVENNKQYWLFVNDDSIGYTSDASATKMEVVVNLSNAIDAAVSDTVESNVLYDGAYSYFIYIRSSDDFGGYACSTSMPSEYMSIYGDSTWRMMVYRTKANPGVLDGSDSAYLVKVQTFDYDDTLKIDTFSFIDNLADSDLGSAVGTLLDRGFLGKDSVGNKAYRYGAPGFLLSDVTVENDTFYGVYGGWPFEQVEARGMAYACIYMDTITGLGSCTSRTCVIWKNTLNQADSTFVYSISIPTLPSGESGFKVNLYRAVLMSVGNDTTWHWDSNNVKVTKYETAVVKPGVLGYETIELDPKKWVHTIDLDSVYVGRLVLLAQLDDTVRTYTDSTRYDSLMLGGIALRGEYEQSDSPPLMSGMFTFQNRMFALYGNRLYYSDLDFDIGGASINDWNSWNFISIDEGDGDEIVVAYPARDYIRVYKHKASYLVYHTEHGFRVQTDFDGFWPNIDYLGAYGCISAPSFVDAPEGNYYLSEQGVFLETEGVYRTKQREIAFVSKQLDNFDKLSISDKENSYAAYLPSEQKYLLSIGDTCYVWDNRAQAWAAWSLTFSGSALYRAETAVKNYPGDTLYFIRPGEATLYRYGTSETDNGTDIQATWKFAPWFVDHNEYTITDIGVWVSSDDTSANDLALIGYNEKGDSVFGEFMPALSENRYIKKSISPNGALYYQLSVETAAGAGLDSTVIDRFDIYYINQGTVKSK